MVSNIRELLDRKWNITLNYAHRAVNLTTSVLAILNQGQKKALIVHFVPSSNLEPMLELDKETFKLAMRIHEDDATEATE